MSGTKSGAAKSIPKILKDNPDHFKQIGKMGGSAKVPKGFSKMPKAKRSAAGKKGGATSRKPKSKMNFEPGIYTVTLPVFTKHDTVNQIDTYKPERPLPYPIPKPKWYQLALKREYRKRGIHG